MKPAMIWVFLLSVYSMPAFVQAAPAPARTPDEPIQVLASSASSSNYSSTTTPSAPALPEQAPGYESRMQEITATTKDTHPKTSGLPDLLKAYELALYSDPAFQESYATYLANKQVQPIALAQLLPLITLTGNTSSVVPVILTEDIPFPSEFAQQESKSPEHTYGYSVTLSQPIFDLTRWNTFQQSKKQVNQATAVFIAAQQDLIFRLAQAYFTVLKSEDDLSFATAEKGAVGKQLEQTEARFSVGLAAITDVNDFRAQYDSSVAQEIAAENTLANSKEELSEITGELWLELAKLNEDMPLQPPLPNHVDEWLAQTNKTNPNINAAEFAMEAQGDAVKATRAEFLPTFYVNSGYQQTVAGTINNYDGSNDYGWNAGVQGQLNLFSGGGILASVKQSEYQYEAARKNYEKVQRNSVTNTSIAYRAVLTSISEVHALEQAVVSADVALKANQASYAAGVKTAIDVTNSISNLYQQQRNYAAARYDYVLSVLALNQATGILSPEDIARVNQWLERNL